MKNVFLYLLLTAALTSCFSRRYCQPSKGSADYAKATGQVIKSLRWNINKTVKTVVIWDATGAIDTVNLPSWEKPGACVSRCVIP